MRNRRRAFSLIKLLAIGSIGTVLAGIAAMMLAGLLRAESASRRSLQHESAAHRLGEQFRRDVRAAEAVEDAGRGRWLLRLSPRESVAYESLPGQIRRTHRKGDAATARESFNLWPLSTASLKIEEAGAGPERERADTDRGPNEPPAEPAPFSGEGSLVILTISAERERELAFEAILGADNRFVEPNKP